MMRLISLWVLSLFFSDFAAAETSLWKISQGKNHVFIGGTIHVMSPSDYPLPEEFEKAYQQSQKLVFETDISKLSAPAFQQQLMQAVSYTDGQTLKSVLKPETYTKLESYSRSIQFPIERLQNFKPTMVVMTLTMLELQRLGLAGEGVDAFFNSRAIKDLKILDGLESTEAHLSFIANMGLGQEDALILNALQEMKTLPKMLQDMKEAWRAGDSVGLDLIAFVPMKKAFPALYDQLLVKRNQAWQPQIEAMFLTPEVEMVLVGAGHLVGNDGLIKAFKQRGYKVEQFK